MIKNGKRYGLILLILCLIIINIYLLRLERQGSKHELTFAMLDIGQGDALFVESPTGTQVLIDAGPPRKVLSGLKLLMSPFDKNLDAIIITNPDQDHIGGFLDVLDFYKVDKVFEPGTINESKTYQNLKAEIKNKNILDVLARQGMRLDLGGGAVIDILFPDRDVSDWSSNDGSIVARLSYGDTSVMLTGDTTLKAEKIIAGEYDHNSLQSDILKVAHHGSRTSTGVEFIEAVKPSYAFISDGKDNKYGHPHQEVVEDLLAYGAQIFRTDMVGTIIMKSDGRYVNIKP